MLSSTREITSEVQLFDKMDSEIPASVKLQQPEVYIDYPDEDMTGSMESYSLLPSNNIKLEPICETNNVESSTREITSEVQVFNKMDGEIPASVKLQQPEAYIDYPDEDMTGNMESYSLLPSNNIKLEPICETDNVESSTREIFDKMESKILSVKIEQLEVYIDYPDEEMTGNMESYSLLPSNNIKLEPICETDNVESSIREITSEVQVFDKKESKIPSSAKVEQPGVYIDYPGKAEPSAITNVLTVALPPVAPFSNNTSIASGSQQTLSTSLPQFSITPMVCNKQAMSTPLPQLNITHTLAPLPQPPKPDYERPSYSYMDLIKMALKESKDGQLTLKEIMSWIEEQFPFFKYKATQSWRSSVRCNLSLHQDFIKVNDKKRGGKWKVAEDARSHRHILSKPPVIKKPTAPKVPAVTCLKSCRSGPLPILSKSVPYALVSLGLPTLEQKNKTQNIHDQAMQTLQQQRFPALQPLQVQQIFHNQQPEMHVIIYQHPLTSASSANSHQLKDSLQQIFHNQQPQTHVITSQHPIVSASSANSHQLKDSHQQIFQQTPVIVGGLFHVPDL